MVCPSDAPAQVTSYCPRCGGSVDAGVHVTCEAGLRLEPPRYCSHCRRRMVVQVTPAGWSARCVEHGTSSGATGTG